MMALIERAKGRRETQAPSGYTRLFGIPALGNLMSRIQGAVISSGSELESLIWERCRQIDDLDAFILNTLHSKKTGIWVARKKQIKASERINSRYEPDFVGFDLMTKTCYVIEVKDGDTFDTKKAAGEHKTLKDFTNDISNALPFSFRVYLCSFNATSKEDIFHGLKRKFSMDEILTGRELCALFDIDYDEIVAIRGRDQEQNLRYFVTSLLTIPPVRSMIAKAIDRLKNT